MKTIRSRSVVPLLEANRFELPHLLGDRCFDGKTLHTAGTIEAVDAAGILKDVSGIIRHRDGPTVAKDDDVFANASGGVTDGLDRSGSLFKGERGSTWK